MPKDFEITSLYRHDEAVIRIHGPISEESIIVLCDEINLALDYYYYPQLILQIDSPGGSATALDYYIQQLSQWRRRQVRIATEALTAAYSAAAIMLSLGDIGQRRAHVKSKLLYHNPRVVTNGAAIDTRMVMDIYRQLSYFKDSMVDSLAQHVYQQKILREVDHRQAPPFRWRKMLMIQPDLAATQEHGQGFRFDEIDCGENEHLSLDQVKLAYQALNLQDLIISSQQAHQMLLIDSIIDEEEIRI